MTHLAVWLLLLLWLGQFIAWRREVVARENLELRLQKLHAYYSITAHPALRNRPAPDWVKDLEGDTDEHHQR